MTIFFKNLVGGWPLWPPLATPTVGTRFSDSRDPIFSNSRDLMIIFSDSRDLIFNSRDPNRVLKTT